MGFFGKIFKNKQVVTIVALIACFAILIFAYRYRVDKAINAISVPVAKMRLEPRTLIDENCFVTKKVAQSMLSVNVIKYTSELVGGENSPAKYVNYNTFIPEGSLFYKSQVTTWDKMPDSAWADIEDGKTIYSLRVDDDATYGNSIFPGDVIDLYFEATEQSGQRRYFIGRLFKDIKVLAVKDANGEHIFKRSAEQKNARSLIFAVSNDEFLLLQRAFVAGKLIPVPRGASDKIEDPTTEVETGYITNYINVQSKISTDDATINKTQPNVKD